MGDYFLIMELALVMYCAVLVNASSKTVKMVVDFGAIINRLKMEQ
jgi:Sec-independent protein translocase protein TatA